MQIDSITELDLTAQDEAAIVALLANAFDTDFGGRSYYKQRHTLRIVARVDGAVVGHMAVLYRAVRLGGRLIDIVGLAEVATSSAYRGRGIASALMTEALAVARASGGEFFLLFGDRPLYAGVGFQNFPHNPMRWVGMDGAVTGAICNGESENLMVLPLGLGVWDPGAPLDLMGSLF